MSRSPEYVQDRRVGLIVWIFGIVGRVLLVLIAALLMSILIEWVGMTWIWPEQGLQKSASMYEQEIRYAGNAIRRNPLVTDPGVLFSVSRRINQGAQTLGIAWLAEQSAWLGDYVMAALYMLHVFVMRLVVMFFATPVYLIFGVVGLTRGLVKREIRKWGGGRESSSMFHLFLKLMPLGFMGSWFIYLAWPVSINPNVIVLPFAVAFGFLVMSTSYRYKKYL